MRTHLPVILILTFFFALHSKTNAQNVTVYGIPDCTEAIKNANNGDVSRLKILAKEALDAVFYGKDSTKAQAIVECAIKQPIHKSEETSEIFITMAGISRDEKSLTLLHNISNLYDPNHYIQNQIIHSVFSNFRKRNISKDSLIKKSLMRVVEEIPNFPEAILILSLFGEEQKVSEFLIEAKKRSNPTQITAWGESTVSPVSLPAQISLSSLRNPDSTEVVLKKIRSSTDDFIYLLHGIEYVSDVKILEFIVEKLDDTMVIKEGTRAKGGIDEGVLLRDLVYTALRYKIAATDWPNFTDASNIDLKQIEELKIDIEKFGLLHRGGDKKAHD